MTEIGEAPLTVSPLTILYRLRFRQVLYGTDGPVFPMDGAKVTLARAQYRRILRRGYVTAVRSAVA
jgi:hypothetical protein